MVYENGLFIFRRDYRLVDNIGLYLTNSKCKHVYTIFIFTPEQVSNANSYKSKNAIQFMIESLDELSREITKNGGKLHCFYGTNNQIIKECIDSWNIQYVCFNADFSPYAIERDETIEQLCKKRNVVCEHTQDYYLNMPGSIVNQSGKPYVKFTPYYNQANTIHHKVALPLAKRKLKLASGNHSILEKHISLDDALEKFVVKPNLDILVHGGRKQGIIRLKHAVNTQSHYSHTRNELEKPTSLLSAYIKFGCVSIREVYHAFRSNKELIRQLYWREFYMQILYCFPYVLEKPMKPIYSHMHWNHNEAWLKAWQNGTTGFPIVDASMTQMNTTGYMHNRARLIVASFLTKILIITWKEGEKYFARHLTDYDPASNNGNWQWNASTGVDSQPYFRIFNPWLQSEKNDPDAIYIKKWLPQLESVPAKDLHRWNETWREYSGKINYPKPICEYEIQKEKALKLYSAVFH